MSYTSKYPGNWFHISGKTYPEFPDWRQLGNMYGSYMDALDEYKAYYVSKRTSSLTVETVNLTTNIVGLNQMNKRKMNLPDGGVYFPSYQAYESLVVYPDNSYKAVTGNQLYNVDSVLSPIRNDTIILAPYYTSNFRSQDTTTFTVTNRADTSSNYKSLQYTGLVVADDGMIHAKPISNYNEVAKFNPSTNAITFYGNASITSNSADGFQSAVNNDGILYMPPSSHIEGKWYIRKIDPVAETINDIELFDSTQQMIYTSSMPYKNKVVFFTYNGGNTVNNPVCFFHTNNNTLTYSSNSFATNVSLVGAMAPDGCLYCVETISGYLWRTDLEEETSVNMGVQINDILALNSNGYLIGLKLNGTSTNTTSSYFKMKLFDVPIDPNFLCNRYLNTT